MFSGICIEFQSTVHCSMPKIILKIYIAGLGKRNADTIANCKAACASLSKAGMCSIQVIDILKSPSIAEKKKILATPTIIRESPPTEKRIIGEFKDIDVARKAIEFLTADVINQITNDKSKRASKVK